MKFLYSFLIIVISTSSFGLTKHTRSNIKLAVEDNINLASADIDGNDIVFCSNWQYESDSDNNSIHRLTASITPIAAGAEYKNSVFIRNPCNGPAEIELRRPEDACSAETIIESVNQQGGMVLWTSSFTENAFSSTCGKKSMINVDGNEVCAPNKSFVIIECQGGSSIDLSSEPNNELPFAKLFHVDAFGDGTGAGNDADDVNSDTIFGGIATIIVGHCDDPVSKERINFIDALDIRNNLGVNDCTVNADTCRSSITSVLNAHRTTGWSNMPNLKTRTIPGDHGIDFSVQSFIEANLYTLKPGGNGRRESPIFDNSANKCSDINNRDSYVNTPGIPRLNVPLITKRNDISHSPSRLSYLYVNRSDSNGSGPIGLGDYGTIPANSRYIDFANMNKISIYDPSKEVSMIHGYCVYNGENCPTGIIDHSSDGVVLSTSYVPIPADPTLGTDAFCVGQSRVYSGANLTGTAHGNLIYNVCDSPINGGIPEAEKDNFKMMTLKQYNALYRDWEKVDANWSGGESGVGNAYVDRYNSNFLLYSTQTRSDCNVENAHWSLETTNGDFVRVPNPVINSGCSVSYHSMVFFDFDDSDNVFTPFTETSTRVCARSELGNTTHYVGYYDDNITPSRQNAIQMLTHNLLDENIYHAETVSPGTISSDYLSQDIIQNGRVYLPGSTCPQISTIHNYELY